MIMGELWSRDWKNFKWDEVKKRLDNVEKEEAGNGEYDVGRTKKELLEYLDWLCKNAPEEYFKVVFGLQMMEGGLSENDVAVCMAHMEDIKKAMDHDNAGEFSY